MPEDGVPDSDALAARRRFLDLCGKFAVGMPPAIALLVASAANADHSPGGGHSGCVPPQNPHDPPCND